MDKVYLIIYLKGTTNNNTLLVDNCIIDLGLATIEGVSHYDSLIPSELLVLSKREHLLHNIDDYFGYEAVRKTGSNAFKVLKLISLPKEEK